MAKTARPKGPQSTSDSRSVNISHNAVDRWALVVGVSDYEHAHKGISNLRFAHHDAEKFSAKLKTPACGSFPQHNVRLLTNKDATLFQVQRALRSFLAEPKEDDLVIIYFSCHGAPDPRRPDQRYFFTYDTDPGDIAGTALPMHEIQTCISRTLRAKWVIVIADACHSGALTATKSGGADAEVQNQFMQSLKASKESLAWLTSSQANQVSFEYPEIGNGVFTHYLLRGMEGEADGFLDGNKDGVVTIQELFQYVHEKVKEHTGNAQIPTPGPGDFDSKLPLAYTGEIQANDYFEVGKSSFYLGETLSDPERLLAAESYFQRSVELSRAFGLRYEAVLLGIRALMAAGDFVKAMDALSGLTGFMESRMNKGELSPKDLNMLGEACYYQGVLHLLLESTVEDVQGCQARLSQACPGHPRSGTLEELLRLRTSKKSRMFVILVGIDQYENVDTRLGGSLNDIGIIEKALFKRWERVGDVRLVSLANQTATREQIELAFRKVAEEAHPLDSFLFHFSGMGGELIDKKHNTVILPFDGKTEDTDGRVATTIQADLFHDLMKSIPCIQKFAILDTVTSPQLVALVEEEPLYNLLYASSIGKNCFEVEIEGKTFGVFSKSVADALETSSGPTFWQDILDNVNRYQPEQEPMLVGDTGFLFEAVPYSLPILLKKVFVLAEIPTLSDIQILERFFFRVPHFQELQIRLIQLFERHGLYKNGQAHIAELEKQGRLPSFILPSAIYVCYQDKAHYKALDLIRELYERYPDGQLENLISRYTALLEAPVHALLVGIDATATAEPGRKPLSASRDVEAIAQVLQEVFGMKAANITILRNEEATSERIQAAFEELVQRTTDSQALFYYAGFGRELDKKWQEAHIAGAKGVIWPITSIEVADVGLLCADGREISLTSLTALGKSGKPENLYACFDCGVSGGSDRYEQGFPSTSVGQYDISAIGAFSLFPGITANRRGWSPGRLENKAGGVFTQALLRILKQMPKENLKIGQVVKALKRAEIPFIDDNKLFPRIFGNENKLFLQPDPHLETDMELLRKFFMRRAREVFSRFESHDPRVLIELAFVQHLLGDSKGGAQTLEGLRGKFPIHFPLGRILVESAGEDDKDQWNLALKELRECPDQNSPAISYYLGRALLGLIRAEKETEVEALFSRYADAGFPLGDREEVETYLNSRDPEKQIRVLLLKARNKEKEQSLDGAIEALEQAVSLGSKKAMEELMRVAALLEQWEKVMATGMSLIKSGKGSESFEENFVNHILEALRQEYPVATVKDILEKSEKVQGKQELLSWIAAYQKFLDKNPIPTINEISAQ